MDYKLNNIVSLITEIHYKAGEFLRKRLAEEGLKNLVSSHGNIIFQLSINGKMTMKEITEKINKDKSTTTALIKKLENEGYVERVKCTADSRVTYINLSEKGGKMAEPCRRISKDLIETCYKGFTNNEKEAACFFLEKIYRNFSDNS